MLKPCIMIEIKNRPQTLETLILENESEYPSKILEYVNKKYQNAYKIVHSIEEYPIDSDPNAPEHLKNESYNICKWKKGFAVTKSGITGADTDVYVVVRFFPSPENK